ncbi:MAG: hypothetical protein ACRYFX_05470 [Janthinobacterium lividum]
MKQVLYLAAILLWLSGCESHPFATEAATAPTDSASVLVADSVAAPAAAPRPSSVPLPPDTSLLAARRAVLRQATLPADTSAPLIPKPNKLPPYSARQARGYTCNYRYVGTLGEQPVVLELTGQQDEQGSGKYGQPYYFGRYYFGWGGEKRDLSSEGYRNDQPLVLLETRIPHNMYDSQDPNDMPSLTGTWQALERLGPVLTGTWTDKATRRTTRFELHEDYTGAVRYEDLEVRIEAKETCRIPNHQVDGSYEYYQRGANWWGPHLLEPDTLRPAWQQLQCPVPRQIRQQLAGLLTHTDCNGKVYCMQKNKLLEYNGDGFVTCTDVWSTITAASQPSQHVEEHTYDLTTGKECRIADWLRPDKLREVRQLAIRYFNSARNYAQEAPGKSPYSKEKLPDFLLSSTGIAFRFFPGANDSDGYSLMQHTPVTIPYAALSPYVQPGTPLARLVAARTRRGR